MRESRELQFPLGEVEVLGGDLSSSQSIEGASRALLSGTYMYLIRLDIVAYSSDAGDALVHH